jgi:N-acetylglucosamine-6-phosphate deacetylase
VVAASLNPAGFLTLSADEVPGRLAPMDDAEPVSLDQDFSRPLVRTL